MPVLLLSLAAALAFAVAVVLQQHAAAAEPPEHNLRPSLVLRLLRRPLWLVGIGASAVGTALQLLALWHGSLVAVQPLLVCGLLFALPINAIWLHGRRLRPRELVAAATVCVGLSVLLVSTDPRRGTGTSTAKGWAIALSALLAVVLILVAFAVISKRATWKAGLLAAAGGVINGLSAAFVKGVARAMAAAWPRGVGATFRAMLSNWELYAFAATLVLVVLLVQSAFQTGPIRWSLPALTAANPIASVALGATILGEHIDSSPLALAGASVGLVLVVSGIMALSSSSLITGGAEPALSDRDSLADRVARESEGSPITRITSSAGRTPAADRVPSASAPATPAAAMTTPGSAGGLLATGTPNLE